MPYEGSYSPNHDNRKLVGIDRKLVGNHSLLVDYFDKY